MKSRLSSAALFSAVLGSLAVAGLTGCGEDAVVTPDQPQQGTGVERGTESAALELNPYGVSYPSEGIGTRARSGRTAGDKIKNFKFQGYPDGLTANGLKPMKLADYYDPEVRNNVKLIHFQASGTWCVYCRQESTETAPKIKEWRDKGVIYVLSMAEGVSPGVPAEVNDLDKWLVNFNLVTPGWLDSGNQQLGVFYEAAAMPWNATVDATTMEIIDSHMGFEGVGPLEANFTKWIAEIDARNPAQ